MKWYILQMTINEWNVFVEDIQRNKRLGLLKRNIRIDQVNWFCVSLNDRALIAGLICIQEVLECKSYPFSIY
jgi:hypothetical protein